MTTLLLNKPPHTLTEDEKKLLDKQKGQLDTVGAVRAALLMLDPSRVVGLYSGRPGCACGCKGTHTDLADDPKAVAKAKAKITRMLKTLDEHAEDGKQINEWDDIVTWAMFRPSNPGSPFPNGIIHVEAGDPNNRAAQRANTIYFV